MRIAVVGNGPSAQRHAAEWGSADMVVRCNVFLAGRCDVWCSHFDPEITAAAKAAPDGVKALWLALSPGSARLLRGDYDARAAAAWLAAGRPVRQMSDIQWIELSVEAGEKRPSTGLIAVRLALELCPEELLLAGFDATEPGRPGWGSPPWDWAAEPGRARPHNFPGEKQALGRLVNSRRFCGVWWRTAVRWLT